MISVNDTKIEFKQFPDGTQSTRVNPSYTDNSYQIEWRYDNEAECMQLWHLVHHLRAADPNASLKLFMPYIPNARMDRVKNRDEIFTLKWFAEFLNHLAFKTVAVLDPHSNVSEAVINNIVVMSCKDYVDNVLECLESAKDTDVLLCYPDEGAAKRYSELFSREYVFGIKHRDWRTGKIERLELTTPEKVNGRTVLIVDDICSRGGTFTHTAKALRDAGASDIYLYVSHCENAIADGLVLTDGQISHVYTTDSIYRGNDPKVTVLSRKVLL